MEYIGRVLCCFFTVAPLLIISGEVGDVVAPPSNPVETLNDQLVRELDAYDKAFRPEWPVKVETYGKIRKLILAKGNDVEKCAKLGIVLVASISLYFYDSLPMPMVERVLKFTAIADGVEIKKEQSEIYESNKEEFWKQLTKMLKMVAKNLPNYQDM